MELEIGNLLECSESLTICVSISNKVFFLCLILVVSLPTYSTSGSHWYMFEDGQERATSMCLRELKGSLPYTVVYTSQWLVFSSGLETTSVKNDAQSVHSYVIKT